LRYFELIRQEYNNRRHKFRRSDKKKIIPKAYDRFRRGSEIRFKDLGGVFLSDMLIEIPQTNMVKKKIDDLLIDVENSSGMGVQVIYGEYGQGKSQISQILIENYSNYSHYPNILHFSHKISTFEKFLKYFCFSIKNQFERSQGLSKIEEITEKIEKKLEKEQIPIAKTIDLFIEVIKESTRQGRIVLLTFDEIDSALTDSEEFKPWGDLFVRLNDSEDLMLILIFLLPRAIGDKVRSIDTRLQRFDLWFGIKSVILPGRYQKQVPKAVANILSMKSISSNINFNDFCLEFTSEALEFQNEKLMKDSIRSVNIWAVELSEMLQELMNLNWDRLFSEFSKEDKTKQGDILELQLRKFLIDCQIADIKIKNPDTEGFDIYQSFFYNDNLKHENKESDGKFVIAKLEDKVVVENIEVAVEIKFTSTGEHTSNQISKIKKLSSGYPLIFFSLGSSENYYKTLLERVDRWFSESHTIYPILILRLPKNLLSPLLILGEIADPEYLTSINILMAWAKRFCPFLSKIENFFYHLPEKLYERQIVIKSESLKSISQKTIDKKSVNGAITFQKKEIQISPWQNAVNMLCSIIDSIKKHKLIYVLEREINNKVSKEHPKVLEDFRVLFPKLLKELISKEKVKQFEYGKDKKPAIKKITLNWNINESVQILNAKYL